MLFYLIIGTILINFIWLMARIKKFDLKSQENRERVRKHRSEKKLKLIYENQVQKYLDVKKKKNDEENPPYQSDVDLKNDDGDDDVQIFESKLKSWAIKHRTSAKAMSELLKILRFAGFSFLPKDSRTVMQTPKNLNIKNLSNGQLWYNGVVKCIENIAIDHTLSNVLTLDWNFDGLPVFKSSSQQFWPMLASIRGDSYTKKIEYYDAKSSKSNIKTFVCNENKIKSHQFNFNQPKELPQVNPMIIGIWCGESKPPLNEYFEPLIN